jgi:hypothetical protein
VSRMRLSKTFSLLSKAGLTVLAILTVAPRVSAQAIPPPPIIDFSLPAGFQIPPSDSQCILKGHRLDLQCIIANDPDAIRIRAEEAMLEAQALKAAKSGKLDPYHQVETLGHRDGNIAAEQRGAAGDAALRRLLKRAGLESKSDSED